MKVLAWSAPAASRILEVDDGFGGRKVLPGPPFPATSHRQGSPGSQRRGFWLEEEEAVLGRCAHFGRMGMVTGMSALDSLGAIRR